MKEKIYKQTNKSEMETTINVIYESKKLILYTNKVSLQKQLNQLIGEPTKEYKIKRSISGSVWEVSFDEKIKIQRLLVKANIFEL